MLESNHMKVAYIIGTYDSNITFDDWSEIESLANEIVDDYRNQKDIQNEEEKFYIMEYAERKITEIIKAKNA
ncbi:hypothetical protein KLEB273_gp101 [Bacillus phage vB_BauM_KLEB27-3]|nr:hypothetical protein KLEB273_gp101 [Bacillus phage vB_BauM_KLEB27-3]